MNKRFISMFLVMIYIVTGSIMGIGTNAEAI